MSKLQHHQGVERYVTWWCPGCAFTHTIPVTGSPAWGWNGSSAAPTFTPSVLVHGHPRLNAAFEPVEAPRCHTFITDGVIDFLGDCTHALAGQKTPMLEVGQWPTDA